MAQSIAYVKIMASGRSEAFSALVASVNSDNQVVIESIPGEINVWMSLILSQISTSNPNDSVRFDLPKVLTVITQKSPAKNKFPFHLIADIGFNYALQEQDSARPRYIGYAAEKIGVSIWPWQFEPCSWSNDPWVNSPDTSCTANAIIQYISLDAFASGILYNLAPLKTDKKFINAIAAIGIGINFRAGLVLRVSSGFGLSPEFKRQRLHQVSIDVPLADYLRELSQ